MLSSSLRSVCSIEDEDEFLNVSAAAVGTSKLKSSIENEDLMDMKEVEELLNEASNFTTNSLLSSKRKDSESLVVKVSVGGESGGVSGMSGDNLDHIFKVGELEQLMQSEGESEVDLAGGGPHDSVTVVDKATNIPTVLPATAAAGCALEPENFDNRAVAVISNNVASHDSSPAAPTTIEEEPTSTTRMLPSHITTANNSTESSNTPHSCIYLKNWLVQVLPIPQTDPLYTFLGCEHWITLHGTIVNADSDGRSATEETSGIDSFSSQTASLRHTSAWICRVLTENSVQTIDGKLYTLLGEMDKVSTCFSDSSFDSSIFELGFGLDDHEWKERVYQLIGSGPADSNIVASDLLVLLQKGNRKQPESTAVPAVENTDESISIEEKEAIESTGRVAEKTVAPSKRKMNLNSRARNHEPVVAPARVSKKSFKKVAVVEKSPSANKTNKTTAAANDNQAFSNKQVDERNEEEKKSVEKSTQPKAPKSVVFAKTESAHRKEAVVTSSVKQLKSAVSAKAKKETVESSSRKRRVSFSDEISTREIEACPTPPPHSPPVSKRLRGSPTICFSPSASNGPFARLGPDRVSSSSPDPVLISKVSGRRVSRPSEWWKVV